MSEAWKVIVGVCLGIAGICGAAVASNTARVREKASCAVHGGTWSVVDSVMVTTDPSSGQAIAWNRIAGCVTAEKGRR